MFSVDLRKNPGELAGILALVVVAVGILTDAGEPSGVISAADERGGHTEKAEPASRLARLTVSLTRAPACGSKAERAMLLSCRLCATPKLARITCGFCLSASCTASRKLSLRGAGSWAKAPAASASSIGILSFMVHERAPEVPKLGRQTIVFTWITAGIARGTAHISARAGILAPIRRNISARSGIILIS